MAYKVALSLPALPRLPPQVRTLDVVFNPLRAQPIPPSDPPARERLPSFLRWNPASRGAVPPSVLRFQVEPEHFEGEARPLIVESLEEPVDFVKYVLRDGTGRAVLVFAPEFGPGAPE